MVSDEQWAALSPAEKMQGLLKAAGYGLTSMMGMGDAGRQAVDNPGTTLATAAAPVVIGAAARSAVPYVAPTARALATALENRFVSGGIGAVEGYRQGGVPGAVIGAATGGTFGPRAGRELRKTANRFDPPVRQPNPNTVASRRMVEGMGAAGQPVPVAPVAAAPAPTPVAATAPPAVAPAAPVASTPAPLAPQAVPVAPGPATPAPRTPQAAPGVAQSVPTSPGTRVPRLSPQQLQNELGLAARRGHATLSEAEYVEAAQLVSQGKTPVQAVMEMKHRQPPPPPVKLQMNAAESKLAARLIASGKTEAEARAAIEQGRALASQLGTPQSENVRRRVVDRNAAGQWIDEP